MATRVTSPRFVGRQAELDVLETALADARAARPSVVLVGGEAGVGKSRLLEDLHWADPSTRDLVRFLVRSTTRERLAVIATYRTDELHRRHPLRPLLGELEREPGVRRITVEPFSRNEFSEQVAAIRESLPEQ